VEKVVIGDLEDMQDLLCAMPADLLVANSHAADLADQFSIPLIRAGFPIFDRLGGFVACVRDTPACATHCLSWRT
jgi:nitrogenase molybdenum-iron protein NifN